GDEIGEPNLLERVVGRIELALAAVDEDQVGKRSALFDHLAIPPPDDLSHRGEVVEKPILGTALAAHADRPSRLAPHTVLAVLALLHPPVFADDQRRNGFAALDRGDVEA